MARTTRADIDAMNEHTIEQERSTPQARVYASSRTVDHDLFKLEVAAMLKNMAWSEDGEPDYVKIEHCHFFHSVDSDGKAQTLSTPIGGHFHEIEVVPDPTGGVPQVVCKSGPRHFVKKKIKGRWVKVAEPVNHDDDHTHEVTYLRSDKVGIRQVNVEAVRIISADAAKVAGVPGVIG